jgi:hypothetical protein
MGSLHWTGPAERSLRFERWSVPGRPVNVSPLCGGRRRTALGNHMRLWPCVVMLVAMTGCDSRKENATTRPAAKPAATRPTAMGKDPFKVLAARDSATGTDFRVSVDGRVLTATGEDGQVLWTVNVMEKAGAPFVGEPTIRHLSVVDGEIAVTYGKHSFANFEIKTGRLLSSGSD